MVERDKGMEKRAREKKMRSPQERHKERSGQRNS